MKQLIGLLVVVAVGFLVYSLFLAPPSEEEQEVIALEDAFEDAQKSLRQAGRTAALSGTDTTSLAEGAVGQAKQVKEKLMELMARLTSDSAVERARRLERNINEFLSRNDQF